VYNTEKQKVETVISDLSYSTISALKVLRMKLDENSEGGSSLEGVILFVGHKNGDAFVVKLKTYMASLVIVNVNRRLLQKEECYVSNCEILDREVLINSLKRESVEDDKG
jgi:hypothetical protein